MPVPIPRTYRDRALINERCKTDAAFRAIVIEQCAADVAFFCNVFCHTYDPRPTAPMPEMPFLLYPFQVDFLRRIDKAAADLDDLLVEKSRDMGVTWCVMVYCLHGWLFRRGFQALLGSRKQDLVDDGTFDSHFGKLEFMLRRLPGYLLPSGFSFDKHRMKLRLKNPNKADATVRGNAIKGESANAEFARQGRYTLVFVDEAAFWFDFQKAWRAAASTTKTRVGVSTPNGMNSWGRLVHLPNMARKLIRLHWRLHPLHDQAWYEAECNRIGIPEDIAQELDISYTLSTRGRVYTVWDKCLFGVYPRMTDWTSYVSWDFGLDSVAIVWWQRNPMDGQLRVIDCYKNAQKPIDFYIPFVTGELWPDASPEAAYNAEYTTDEVAKITVHGTWGRAVHYGDPNVNSRTVTSGKSVQDILSKHGLYIHTNDAANDFPTRKRFTELGIRGLQVNVPQDGSPIGAYGVDDAMRAARYPTRSAEAQITSAPALPVHDDSSHYRTAVEFFFVNLPAHRSQRAGTRPTPVRKTSNKYDNLTRR